MSREKKQLWMQLMNNGFFTAILVALLGVFAFAFALL